MVANGTFTANGNSTYFIGTSNQEIVGSPIFWNLYKTTGNNLSINNDIDVDNELHLDAGTFSDGDNTLSVQGSVWMDITHDWGESSDGILMNGTSSQVLTGSGTFGKLTINNSSGISLPAGSEFTISGALELQRGVLDIGKNLLILTENAEIIEGNAFSENNMIRTNISFTDAGVKKFFPAISSATSFIYPIGSQGKYTPVEFDITQKDAGGSIRVKAADEMHPTITNDTEPCNEIEDTANVLKYHWIMEAVNITGFTANASMKYYSEDYQENSAFYDETDYIAARLLAGSTLWNKFDETSFDEVNNLLRFSFNGTDDNGISGDYTAGIEDQNGICEGAIPDQVPAYITINDGNWTDENIWDTYPTSGGTVPAGGPRGAVVIVEHDVTVAQDYLVNYKTTINSTGIIRTGSTFGHRLGIVEGTGTLQLERGNLPAGIYDNFFSRSGGTLEYAGSDDYDVLSEVTALRNLKFSGTGERRFPNLDFEVYGEFTIAGDDATLEVINEHDRNITLDSTITFTQGSFDAGIGNSTVIINGTSAQTLSGNFTGSNDFWNFEMNNSAGLILSGPIEIDNNLSFTSGIIQTDAVNMLTVANSSTTAVTGYGSTAYVDGPMQKLVNSGDDFIFPVGDGNRYGKVEVLNTSASSAGYWEAEYYDANANDAGLDTSQYASPLQGVSGNEYWRVQGPEATSSADVKIRWDNQSGLPAATSDRAANLHIAEWLSTQWESVGDDVTDNGPNDGTVQTNAAVTLEEHYFTLGTEESAPLGTVTFSSEDTTICSTGSATLEFELTGTPDWRIELSLDTDPGADPDYTFIASASPHTETVTDAGTYTITGVWDNNGTTAGSVYGDPMTVTVVGPPATFNVTGGGSYCAGSGGVPVGLDGSELNVNYELYLDGSPTGNVVAGTGSAISFGNQTTDGSYSVVAEDLNGVCTGVSMTGSVTVTTQPVPTATDQAVEICSEVPGENAEATVHLTSLETSVNNSGTVTFTWYEDAALTTEVADPTAATITKVINGGAYSETEDYYVEVDNGSCTNTATVVYTMYRTPETGPQYHISNTFAQ